MHLWRLMPLDLDSPLWVSSSHKEPAVVRAISADEARTMAALAFATVAARHPFGRTHLQATPWLDPALVAVEPASDEPHPADGPAGVVAPAPAILPVPVGFSL